MIVHPTLSPAAQHFLQQATEFFPAHKYRLGADTSGLMSERQAKIVDFVTETGLDLVARLFGSTGASSTKQIGSEKALKVLAPFTQLTDLLAWKPSEIVPVIVADDMNAETLQELLDVYFNLASQAASALSESKYTYGLIRIFPLLVFTGRVNDLGAIRSVRISREPEGFWQRLGVYLNAGILTLGDGKVFWPKGKKPSEPLQKLGSLLPVQRS